jgi:hypothetical protein
MFQPTSAEETQSGDEGGELAAQRHGTALCELRGLRTGLRRGIRRTGGQRRGTDSGSARR